MIIPAPHLTLITPVRDGAAYIEASLREMVAELDELDEPYEILLVCDGCTDDTAGVASRMQHPAIRVLTYPENRGKGFAICFGIAQARGRLIGWLDADLDVHPDVIVAATRRFAEAPVDAVIGSKRAAGSKVDYPRRRRILSWGFQLLSRAFFRIDVRDTQVGAKVFRREMLDTVAPLLLIKRYAFDLEVLAVGAEFGFDRIEEAPVRLDYQFTGTGINVEAVWRMFVDTLAIAYRIHLRHWYVRQYAALQRRRGEAFSAATDGERAELLPAPTGTLAEIEVLL